MAYTLRTARTAYSNVAIGSAAGRENTAIGSAPSTELMGGGSNVAIASSEPTSTARDRMITSTGGVTTLPPQEYPENQN